MSADPTIASIGIAPSIARKLEDLEIRSVRQLYSRLQNESLGLQGYLELSGDDFSGLLRKVEGFIQDEFPQDLLPRIHPRINRSGVSIHRLGRASSKNGS